MMERLSSNRPFPGSSSNLSNYHLSLYSSESQMICLDYVMLFIKLIMYTFTDSLRYNTAFLVILTPQPQTSITCR